MDNPVFIAILALATFFLALGTLATAVRWHKSHKQSQPCRYARHYETLDVASRDMRYKASAPTEQATSQYQREVNDILRAIEERNQATEWMDGEDARYW